MQQFLIQLEETPKERTGDDAQTPTNPEILEARTCQSPLSLDFTSEENEMIPLDRIETEDSINLAVPNPPHSKSKFYPKWIQNERTAFSDGNSCFKLEQDGIICRICNRYRTFLGNSRGEYVSVVAHPYATSQLYSHLETDTHLQAVGMWERNANISEIAISQQDRRGLTIHRQNQVRAVHSIAKNGYSVNKFKTQTNLLNSTNNKHFVSASDSSDFRLFWRTAESIDIIYHEKIIQTITTTTPLSLMLDTSTDCSSSTVLCCNLRFLSNKNKVETVLLGLHDMDEGAKGIQLYMAIETILALNGISVNQLISVTSDGDPAMVGHQSGFVKFIKEKNRAIVHVHCGAHRFQLCLKDTFESTTHPYSKGLIHDAIAFVHRITKSHSRQKALKKKLAEDQLPDRKLTKPVKTRWSTCHTVIEESLKYCDVIIAIIQSEIDEKAKYLVHIFSNPENQLRLASILLILDQTTVPIHILQKNELSLAEAKEAVSTLKMFLSSLTREYVAEELQKKMTAFGRAGFQPFLNDTITECLKMAKTLVESLNVRFHQPDDTADLNQRAHPIRKQKRSTYILETDSGDTTENTSDSDSDDV
ncbi:hypothetical protein BLNAU_19027 [Blattamonas nauphoetae]|uniref:DUF4371 domain-containing protein n=1 Tax=Blattamonas nauphoetae TaxID=2049346 RepID=A0ABQ9X5V0_9EUKA|nr:hypothetical protein BLNAU_19027 [Blattamonas nauphoetae]